MSDRRLGRYQLVRLLGAGAMGQVHEGHDPQIDRRVAVKTIRLDGLSDAMVTEFETRFRAEMRAAGRLQHPNIVALHDVGRDAGLAYIVMEYVEGEDLKHKLDAGWRPDVAAAVDLVRQLLAALAAAHAQGVIHRDVKPANVLLTADGRLKLADFGVARLQDGADATRTRGMVVGTPKYAAPEQLSGDSVDARADLFSCGVLLYRLLAGALPFDGPTEMVVMHRLLHETPPPPSDRNPAVPAALDAVVLSALAKDPAGRPPDAPSFAALLAPFGTPGREALDTGLRTPAPTALAPRRARRWPVVVAGLVLLAGLGAAWWGWRQNARAAAVDLSGRWTGLLSCGELLTATSASAPRAPFVDKFSLRIEGRSLRWERTGTTLRETVGGSIEPDGRWQVLGSGGDSARSSRWLTRGSGFYNLAVTPHRLDGEVQILSEDARRIHRRCSVGAVRDKGGG